APSSPARCATSPSSRQRRWCNGTPHRRGGRRPCRGSARASARTIRAPARRSPGRAARRGGSGSSRTSPQRRIRPRATSSSAVDVVTGAVVVLGSAVVEVLDVVVPTACVVEVVLLVAMVPVVDVVVGALSVSLKTVPHEHGLPPSWFVP